MFSFYSVHAQEVINGSFDDAAEGWGCSPEAYMPETIYGGSDSSNIVAEVDFEANLCQTVSGFDIGCTYTLEFRCARRTTCGSSAYEFLLSIDNDAFSDTVSRSEPFFNFSLESFTFQATSDVHEIKMEGITPIGCGLVVDDIVIYEGVGMVLGNDTTLCDGEVLIIDPGITEASVIWQDNSVSDAFVVTEEGMYFAESLVNGCLLRDTVEISYFDLPSVYLGPDTSICAGEQLSFAVDLQSDLSILWPDSSINTSYSIEEEGIVWVEVRDTSCNTFDRDSIEVFVETVPEVFLGTAPELCFGATFVLASNVNNGSYLWQDGSIDPVFVVQNAGWYSLTVSNFCGSDTDSLYVPFVDCECLFFIPNSFTPNGDGDNDVFPNSQGYDCRFDRFNLSIFDRWGRRVFETTDPDAQWDGTYKGNILPMGVYVYLYSFESNGRFGTREGIVNLFK